MDSCCLQQHGLNSGYPLLFQDFDVGDEVSSVDVEDGAEAALMEASKESQVVTICDPRLRAVQEGGGWLVDNFRLLQADLESEVLNSLCKAGYNALQGCLRMGKKGSIVGEEKLLDELLLFWCGPGILIASG